VGRASRREANMRLRRCAAALSAAVLVIALGGASGGVAQAAGGARAGPDLSTGDAAKAYLVSQGFDPSRFTFQVGLKNYSGSQCPGLDWNCTTANLIVQIAAPGGINWADCAPDAQQCVIVQGTQPVEILGGGSETNLHGHCPEAEPGKRVMAHETPVTLTCMITQDNETPGGNNHAVAGIAIHDNDGSTQFAQEDATVTQSTSGDGDNHAVVHEEIVLSTSEGSTQTQDGFQSLKLTQTTETGDNFGDVKQTQHITARARSDGSEQLQQTTERPLGDPCSSVGMVPANDTNSCVEFHQTTGAGGSNDLNVHQDHNVEAVASGTGADQTQGCTSKACGLEVSGSQGPLGSTNNVDNHQSITYTLRGPDGTIQRQDPPIRNQGGMQTGSLDDLWKVGQLAVLTASDEDATQAHINEVFDTSTGTVDAQSIIIIDGDRSEVVCNASTCDYVQACGDVPGAVEIELFCPGFPEEPGPTFTGVTRTD
jgi:hypothetical protein